MTNPWHAQKTQPATDLLWMGRMVQKLCIIICKNRNVENVTHGKRARNTRASMLTAHTDVCKRSTWWHISIYIYINSSSNSAYFLIGTYISYIYRYIRVCIGTPWLSSSTSSTSVAKSERKLLLHKSWLCVAAALAFKRFSLHKLAYSTLVLFCASESNIHRNNEIHQRCEWSGFDAGLSCAHRSAGVRAMGEKSSPGSPLSLSR